MRVLIPIIAVFTLFVCAMHIQAQEKAKEFALYLLPNPGKRQERLHAQDISRLKKPAGEPLISMSDIDHYQKDRHEIGLHYTAALKLNKLALELRGRPFAIFVGEEPIYAGAFWPSNWSQSYDGVNIDTFDFKGDFPVLKLRFGYPREKFATVPDPRSDPRVFRAFEDAKMLRQELVIRGKCKIMKDTMKRRAGIVFTFSVDSVLKGNYKDREITFETWADMEGGKLMDALGARGIPYGDNWTFDKDKEVLLKFEQRTDLSAQPYWFWFRTFE
jgi:hypothetical protein